MIEFRKFITRDMLQSEPNKLFVFGDNVIRHGFGGQAREMRGESNAVGIATKWKPSNEKEDFFYNFQFPAVKHIIDEDFKPLFFHVGDIVWPEDGIGTGLSRLPQTAPIIWTYILQKLEHLKIANAGENL